MPDVPDVKASCEKDFECTVGLPEGEMPLDTALYHTVLDQIFAVRGGYIFKLNASSGSIISSSRYNGIAFPYSDLTWDSVNDRLWTCFWHDPLREVWPDQTYMRIFEINPADLSVVSDYGLITSGCDTTYGEYGNGPQAVLYAKGMLYVATMNGTGTGHRLAKYDPTNIPVGSTCNIIPAYRTYFPHIVYDSNQNEVWVNDVGGNRVYGETLGPLASIAPHEPFGFCLCTVNNDLYMACGTQYVIRQNTTTGVFSAIDTARANATPFRARFNAYDNMVYVPLYRDDRVAVIDPSSGDAVTIKTGFDSPIDCVFTPTKKWAVQQGNTGLLEIT